MEKYTKKASARVLKEVLKVNPKASGFTTFDQAFVILMNQWDLELSIETTCNGVTTCTLYRDGDKPRTWELGDVWDAKAGDWDWNTIYKTVLEDIIKEKLYKRPKLGKRALKKLEEERNKQSEQEPQIEEVTKVEEIKPQPTLVELRKRRDNLSVKVYDWNKKGKDTTELQKELNLVKEQIKNFAKTK